MKKPQLALKTSDLLARAGGVRQVADQLQITTQAIYSWGETVPLLRVYQLQAARPEWFKVSKQAA